MRKTTRSGSGKVGILSDQDPHGLSHLWTFQKVLPGLGKLPSVALYGAHRWWILGSC